MDYLTSPIVILICILLAGAFVYIEKYIQWNKGYCSKCNSKWVLLNKNSQLYKCHCRYLNLFFKMVRR